MTNNHAVTAVVRNTKRLERKCVDGYGFQKKGKKLHLLQTVLRHQINVFPLARRVQTRSYVVPDYVRRKKGKTKGKKKRKTRGKKTIKKELKKFVDELSVCII